MLPASVEEIFRVPPSLAAFSPLPQAFLRCGEIYAGHPFERTLMYSRCGPLQGGFASERRAFEHGVSCVSGTRYGFYNKSTSTIRMEGFNLSDLFHHRIGGQQLDMSQPHLDNTFEAAVRSVGGLRNVEASVVSLKLLARTVQRPGQPCLNDQGSFSRSLAPTCSWACMKNSSTWLSCCVA